MATPLLGVLGTSALLIGLLSQHLVAFVVAIVLGVVSIVGGLSALRVSMRHNFRIGEPGASRRQLLTEQAIAAGWSPRWTYLLSTFSIVAGIVVGLALIGAAVFL